MQTGRRRGVLEGGAAVELRGRRCGGSGMESLTWEDRDGRRKSHFGSIALEVVRLIQIRDVIGTALPAV